MTFYFAFFIIGILFTSSGIRALRKPAPYHHTNGNGSPYYESKAAITNEAVWNQAQKWYGQSITIMSILYMLSSLGLHPLYNYILTHLWKHESHNVPFFVMVLIPFMILLGITYAFVEFRIRRYIRQTQSN